MYNYYQPQQQYKPFTGLKGRPVASLEEVKAATIDFDGSIFFFPDLANKRIYTKQINMDGTSSVFMYELKELPTEQSYITRTEFETALAQLKSAIAPASAKTAKEENYEF